MLGMRTDVPVGWRHPLAEGRRRHIGRRAALDPAAEALRLFLVGRVADDDGDLFLPLNLIRAPAGLAERHEDLRNVFLLGVWVAERVGHKEPHSGRRFRIVEERLQLGEEAQLRHCEGAELKLEPDETGQCGFDHAADRPRPLIGFRRLCDPPENAKQECAGPGGRVGNGHVCGCKPFRQTEPLLGPQRFVDQPDHGADHLRWGVVGARLLAEFVVVNAQEVLVEVEPGIRVALAHRGPVNGVEHPPSLPTSLRHQQPLEFL